MYSDRLRRQHGLGRALRLPILVEFERPLDPRIALGWRRVFGPPEQPGNFGELARLEEHAIGQRQQGIGRKELRRRLLRDRYKGSRGHFLLRHEMIMRRVPVPDKRQTRVSDLLCMGSFANCLFHQPGGVPDADRYPILTESSRNHEGRAVPSLTVDERAGARPTKRPPHRSPGIAGALDTCIATGSLCSTVWDGLQRPGMSTPVLDPSP